MNTEKTRSAYRRSSAAEYAFSATRCLSPGKRVVLRDLRQHLYFGGGEPVLEGFAVQQGIPPLLGHEPQALEHRFEVLAARCGQAVERLHLCLLYTSPSPRDGLLSR